MRGFSSGKSRVSTLTSGLKGLSLHKKSSTKEATSNRFALPEEDSQHDEHDVPARQPAEATKAPDVHMISPRAEDQGLSHGSRHSPRLPQVEEAEEEDGAGHDAWEKVHSRRRATTTALQTSTNQSVASAACLNAHTNQDWRRYRKTDEDWQAEWATQRTVGVNTQTLRTRMTTRTRNSRAFGMTGPRTPGGVLHSDQIEGTIVWHFDEREIEANEKIPEGWELKTRPNGDKYIRKGRYHVIILKDGSNIYEVSIYTNGNSGLSKIPKKYHHQYFAFCPMSVDEKHFKNNVTGNALLKIDWHNLKSDEADYELTKTTMYANWTEVRKRNINHHPLRVIARVSQESMPPMVAKALKTIKK